MYTYYFGHEVRGGPTSTLQTKALLEITIDWDPLWVYFHDWDSARLSQTQTVRRMSQYYWHMYSMTLQSQWCLTVHWTHLQHSGCCMISFVCGCVQVALTAPLLDSRSCPIWQRHVSQKINITWCLLSNICCVFVLEGIILQRDCEWIISFYIQYWIQTTQCTHRTGLTQKRSIGKLWSCKNTVFYNYFKHTNILFIEN